MTKKDLIKTLKNVPDNYEIIITAMNRECGITIETTVNMLIVSERHNEVTLYGGIK